MDVFTWLEKPSLNPDQTNLKRIAELIAVNSGSFEVLRWGSPKQGGTYGRLGLTVEEAKELMWLVGVMDGFSLRENGRTDELVTRMLEAVWEEKKKNPDTFLILPTNKLLITE